MSDYNNFWRSQ